MQCYLLFGTVQSHGVTRSSLYIDTGSTSRPVRSAAQPGRRHHETESRSDIFTERLSGMCDVPVCIDERNLVRRAAVVRDMARTYRTSK